MVDLSRIISVVEIESVRLCEAHCRSAVHPSETANAINVKTSRESVVVKAPEDSGSLRIETTFTMEVRSASDDDRRLTPAPGSPPSRPPGPRAALSDPPPAKLQAEIRGTFELAYELPHDETFSSEELQAFGQVNAVFNAWPYWRELVQTSLARMGMPPLTVPVFRLVPEDAADAVEED